MFDTLTDKFSNVFRNLSGRGKISEENIRESMREVRTALLEADVNFQVVNDFVNHVVQKAIGQEVIKSLQPASDPPGPWSRRGDYQRPRVIAMIIAVGAPVGKRGLQSRRTQEVSMPAKTRGGGAVPIPNVPLTSAAPPSPTPQGFSVCQPQVPSEQNV